MYWILFVMGAIAAAAIALLVGGLATARTHEVTRSIVVRSTPDATWNTVRDVARYDEWRHDLESCEQIDLEQSQTRWRETNTSRSFTFGIVAEQPPQQFSAKLLDDDLSYTSEWTWKVTAEGDGARVTITERGSVGNPIARFIRGQFIGYTKPLDRYLTSLAARLGALA